MKIKLLSFLLLFNFSTHVKSCPSSGDGDCVPSVNKHNQVYSTNNQNSNKADNNNSNVNSISNSKLSLSDDNGLPDDHMANETSYLKKINEISQLNSKIAKLNFDIRNLIYNSSIQYNSNLSGKINNKLYEVKELINIDNDVDKSIYNSLNQNIDKLLNTIIYSFNNDESIYIKPYITKTNEIKNQINKYNEINDIIKTLEVMN